MGKLSPDERAMHDGFDACCDVIWMFFSLEEPINYTSRLPFISSILIRSANLEV